MDEDVAESLSKLDRDVPLKREEIKVSCGENEFELNERRTHRDRREGRQSREDSEESLSNRVEPSGEVVLSRKKNKASVPRS